MEYQPPPTTEPAEKSGKIPSAPTIPSMPSETTSDVPESAPPPAQESDAE